MKKRKMNKGEKRKGGKSLTHEENQELDLAAEVDETMTKNEERTEEKAAGNPPENDQSGTGDDKLPEDPSKTHTRMEIVSPQETETNGTGGVGAQSGTVNNKGTANNPGSGAPFIVKKKANASMTKADNEQSAAGPGAQSQESQSRR